LNFDSRQQRTIARPKTIRGVGYWTGEEVTVNFRPAVPNTGFVFVREDLEGCEGRINATPFHCMETPRRTTLSENGCSVEMVEHVLAALAGMQIDNCEIRVSGVEMPAFDGSSQAIVEALVQAGTVLQAANRPCLEIDQVIRVAKGDLWIEAQPTSETGLRISYELDYGLGPIGRQLYETAITPTTFRREIAPARTFLLEVEAKQMQADGIGKNVSYSDLLVFGSEGPIQNELRFADECVRHKILDIVGDLALIGFDLNARVVASKSGHRLNAALAAALVERFQNQRIVKQVA